MSEITESSRIEGVELPASLLVSASHDVNRSSLTGRDRLTRNVLASWAGHLVLVVAGFVIPRVMDRTLGQTMLGVWDFSWSLVSYFGLAQFGIGSSIDRHVAKYRSEKDVEGMNRVASSVQFVQVCAALVVVLAVGLAIWLTPRVFEARLGEHVAEVQWLIALLGAPIALQIVFGTYSGVLLGCHRWDIYNAIIGGSYGLIVISQIITLSLGGGLVGLAAAYFIGTAVTEVTHFFVAHRVCPELRVSIRSVKTYEIRRMISFGGKVFLTSLAGRLLYQTNSILVVSFLGPAALALYSRPMALVRYVMTFVHKLAFVLTPIASELDAGKRSGEVTDLLIRASRYSVYLALPPILLLCILGGAVLRVWMGPHYENGLLLAILALGHLMSISHRSLLSVVTGLSAHGRPAVATLVAAAVSVALCVLTVGPLNGGLLGAAISVGVPLVLLDGLYMPAYACRRLQIPVASYFYRVWRDPLIHLGPYAMCLMAARLMLPPIPALLCGGVVGGALVVVVYWKFVIPTSMRDAVRSRLGHSFLSHLLRSVSAQGPGKPARDHQP